MFKKVSKTYLIHTTVYTANVPCHQMTGHKKPIILRKILLATMLQKAI